MSDTSPSAPPSDTKTRVILVPSALFHTTATAVPPGVRARDLAGFVEGLIEEEAPLPIEQTSWGFLLDNQSKRASHILHYAAATELALPQGENRYARATAVLPGFAALQGISFGRDTWVFLQEDECLSAAFFKSGSILPSKVIARFFDKAEPSPRDIHALREKLGQHLGGEDNTHLHPGLVRTSAALPHKGKAIHFTLEQQPTPDSGWEPWKKTVLKKPTRILAADIRDHTLLGEEAQRRKSVVTVAVAIGSLAAALVLLTAFEIILARQGALASSLSTQAAEQQNTVKRLQDMETMAASIQAAFDKPFLPFDWLMAANVPRSSTISFTSFSLDDNNNLLINARANEVRAANDYAQGLRNTGKFKEVTLSQIQSGREGVTFNLRLVTGNLDAAAIGPTEPVEPEPAEQSAETDSTEPEETEELTTPEGESP